MPTNFSTYIMSIFIQAYNTNFSQCQYSQNPSQNSSNNITNYQHCQNSISHQHCPSYTMIKNEHFKNAPKLTLQHDQSYNAPNFNKNTQQNDNGSPSNFQWSMKQHFSKQRNQRKTHIDVHMRIWSMGPGVLKEPLLIMLIKCWIIFLTMKSKKRGSIERRRHFDSMKNGFENGFHPRLSKSGSYVGSWEVGRIVDCRIKSWIIKSYLFSNFKQKPIDSDFVCYIIT